MRRNHTLRVKLSKDEREQLQAQAIKAGYATLSAYVRHSTLHRDALLHDRLHEVLKLLQHQ